MQSPQFPSFIRKPTRANPQALPHLAAPYRDLTLRQWEVTILLAGCTGDERANLWAWLTATQRPYRWAAAPLARDRPRFSEPFLRDGSAAALREKLWQELLAMQQTLNTSPLALSGPTRNKLLWQHGVRLRQLLEALPRRAGGHPAEREVELMLRWL